MIEDFFDDDLCPADVDIYDIDFGVEQKLDNLPMQDAPTLTIEDDPYGGVIVTDIFGGKHHYADLEQVQTLTDVLSGLSIQITPSHQSTPREGDLPIDIHTPIDGKIEEAQRDLNKALVDADRATDARELEDALARQKQARDDIEF